MEKNDMIILGTILIGAVIMGAILIPINLSKPTIRVEGKIEGKYKETRTETTIIFVDNIPMTMNTVVVDYFFILNEKPYKVSAGYYNDFSYGDCIQIWSNRKITSCGNGY
jgi:hypothetical protein